jgi:GNAT superfamily N-acetyltransferase
MADATLDIRPARAEDRDAVFEMVKTVWGGNDYVPEVWDDWLADTSGPLLVGELAGRVVALAKLSALGTAEDWFHGTRVDPDYRGRGFARAMLRRCVELSRERGARTQRFLTDDDNTPMHRAGESEGFQLAYAPVWYRAALRADTPTAGALPPERFLSLMRDLRDSPLLRRTAGMYSYGWRNLDLDEARLRAHLAGGEVVGLPGDDAWAIVVREDDATVWLAHVEGTPEELERLAAAILAGSQSEGSIRALLPPGAACIAPLRAAGFGAPEDPMRVYELRLAKDRGRRTIG